MIRELFQKVKRKAEQRAGDSFSVYWQNIVARLAAGEELDPEAVVAAAEAVNRDASAVESDVELFKTRSRMVAELKAAPKWQEAASRLQTQLDRLNAELNEAQSRLGKAIAEAYAQKQLAEAQIDGTSQYERDLVTSCPNPALTLRESELIGQRKELLARRQPLIESVADSGPGSLGSALRHAESQLEEYQDLASRGDDDARSYVARMKQLIQSYQARIKQARQSLNELDEQLSTLDGELAGIRQQKLTP